MPASLPNLHPGQRSPTNTGVCVSPAQAARDHVLQAPHGERGAPEPDGEVTGVVPCASAGILTGHGDRCLLGRGDTWIDVKVRGQKHEGSRECACSGSYFLTNEWEPVFLWQERGQHEPQTYTFTALNAKG